MATVYVTMGRVGKRGERSEHINIMRGRGARSERITSSASSAQGNLVAGDFDVATIFCATHLWVNAQSPASEGTGIYVPGNVEKTIALMYGDRIAVIDAS